jgi:hypothetical protein
MANGEHWFAVLIDITGNDARTLGANLALVRRKVAPDKYS